MPPFLQRLRIATKLWQLIAIFTLVGVVDNLTEMALVSERLRAEKETQLQHVVETAHTVLQAYERAAKEGRIPEDAARAQAADAVRQLHYGALEYFWIHDLTHPVPVMVMHPTVPTLDGQALTESRFDRATSMRSGPDGEYERVAGTNLFVAMNRAIERTGDGFITYDWPKPLAEGGVTETLYPKLSYVKRFDAWGWVIGSGIYIDDLETEYWRDARMRLVKAGLWVLLLGLLVWFITRTVVKPLRAFQDTIDSLRANPESIPAAPPEQPGELGHLTRSFIGLMEDLRRSRNELTSSIDKLRKAARAFADMDEGILVTDAAGRILSTNPAFTRLTGYNPEDVVGRTPEMFRSDRHDAAFFAAMWTELERNGQWAGTVWNTNKDGRVRPQWASIVASRDQRGAVRFYVAMYFALTDMEQAEPLAAQT